MRHLGTALLAVLTVTAPALVRPALPRAVEWRGERTQAGALDVRVYGADGLLTREKMARESARFRTYVNGKLTEERQGSGPDEVTAHTYDAAGRVRTVTDALGHVVTHAYWPHGKMRSRAVHGFTDQEYRYDRGGFLAGTPRGVRERNFCVRAGLPASGRATGAIREPFAPIRNENSAIRTPQPYPESPTLSGKPNPIRKAQPYPEGPTLSGSANPIRKAQPFPGAHPARDAPHEPPPWAGTLGHGPGGGVFTLPSPGVTGACSGGGSAGVSMADLASKGRAAW